jgi:hypothetical protein
MQVLAECGVAATTDVTGLKVKKASMAAISKDKT